MGAVSTLQQVAAGFTSVGVAFSPRFAEYALASLSAMLYAPAKLKGLNMQSAISAITKHQTELLNNNSAAEYIGVKGGTLEVWRSTKRHNIPYIKCGRLVRYKKSALDLWLAARTVDADQAA
jgi:excisionase family DNA binding protein